MNFENKYLKYKNKYLELKKLVGGFYIVPIKPSSNSIRINDLPIGTILQHLEAFLKSKGIPISSQGAKLPSKTNDFIINFKDNATAIGNLNKVDTELKQYNPSIVITMPPIVSLFTQPWVRTSKLLFIALPIEQNSEIGQEIDLRTIK